MIFRGGAVTDYHEEKADEVNHVLQGTKYWVGFHQLVELS